jgi:hypothetical protein
MTRAQPARTAAAAQEASEPTPVDLAQAAYEAYGSAVGGLNYMGLPMPPWHELPTKIVDGWVAAAGAVVEALTPESRADG